MGNSEIILKGRLNGIQRNRLKSLFNMMYSPKELSDEIGIHKDQIYTVYVPLGCPQKRDLRNHLLINGIEFADWYSNVYAKIRLKPNETFCKTCKKGVSIDKPKERKKGSLVYVLSICPHCGRGLTKILSAKEGINDK